MNNPSSIINQAAILISMIDAEIELKRKSWTIDEKTILLLARRRAIEASYELYSYYEALLERKGGIHPSLIEPSDALRSLDSFTSFFGLDNDTLNQENVSQAG